ncbi:hypothetical protein P4O66_010112 [Electrophorus voltai]|uniref:Vesicular, overexpressed in cancer, prosurvival protein 1 n=1 Tax=Electrophorus voltai TaxID=2609070 RepID=A0AAD8Z9D8_9TELE|nr:hypothetical protein P4O66_010112 [Electrophorus voltai]
MVSGVTLMNFKRESRVVRGFSLLLRPQAMLSALNNFANQSACLLLAAVVLLSIQGKGPDAVHMKIVVERDAVSERSPSKGSGTSVSQQPGTQGFGDPAMVMPLAPAYPGQPSTAHMMTSYPAPPSYCNHPPPSYDQVFKTTEKK